MPSTDVDPVARPAATALDEQVSGTSRLVATGYILAVAMPIVGFVIGVILANRSEKHTIKQGIWIIAVSVAATFLFFVALIISTHSGGGVES